MQTTLIGFSAILMWSLLALLTASSGKVPPFQLAYYVEFYMRKQLAPILFVEDDPCGVQRDSVVSEVKPSESAKKKARSKRSEDGHRVQSFRGLLGNLGNISMSVMIPKRNSEKGRKAVLHDYEAYAIAEQGV